MMNWARHFHEMKEKYCDQINHRHFKNDFVPSEKSYFSVKGELGCSAVVYYKYKPWLYTITLYSLRLAFTTVARTAMVWYLHMTLCTNHVCKMVLRRV